MLIQTFKVLKIHGSFLTLYFLNPWEKNLQHFFKNLKILRSVNHFKPFTFLILGFSSWERDDIMYDIQSTFIDILLVYVLVHLGFLPTNILLDLTCWLTNQPS